MGNKLFLFQVGVLGLFGLLIAMGVFFLATFSTSSTSVFTSPITVWVPAFPTEEGVMQVFRDATDKDPALAQVSFVERNPLTLYRDTVEAIATGKGPDIVLLTAGDLLPLRNKILPFSFDQYSIRDFRDTYVEGGEAFVLGDGIYALPIAVDPLVLYWNRDLFTNAAVAQVPRDWDTFVRVVPLLATVRGAAELTQAGVAFGEYRNVTHATEILGALMFQTGVRVVTERNGAFVSDLTQEHENATGPSAAVRFYTDFANPVKTVYAWNKTFEPSREAFTANKLALYAGFASEVQPIASTNPNLNFDIASFPQSVSGRNRYTYGTFYAMGVLRSSTDSVRAQQVAARLASSDYARAWEQATSLPTPRRDMLAAAPSDPFQDVIVRSTIMARTWLVPDKQSLDEIVGRMVDRVVAGMVSPDRAVNDAAGELDVVLSVYNKQS